MRRRTITAFIAGLIVGMLTVAICIPSLKTIELIEVEKQCLDYKYQCRCYELWTDQDYADIFRENP